MIDKRLVRKVVRRMRQAGPTGPTNHPTRSKEEAAELARAHFPQYTRALWFWDCKLRNWARDAFGVRYESGDFLGFVYERYVHAWRSYEPSKGTFINYLWRSRLRAALLLDFLRHESESWDRFHHDCKATQFEFDEQNANYAFHEHGFTLYRIPDLDGEWLDEVFERFGGRHETWKWVYAQLSEREQFIVSRRIAGRTLESLGRDIRLTKERIRQIESQAHQKIGTALRNDPRSKDSFQKPGKQGR